MRNRTLDFLLLFLLAIVVSSGCSNLIRPSDEEVIKAIHDSGILKSASFTITAPLVIVERGGQNKDKSWTYRVKMTMTMALPNGKISEPRENAPYFRIIKEKDASGKNVWKAMLGT